MGKNPLRASLAYTLQSQFDERGTTANAKANAKAEKVY